MNNTRRMGLWAAGWLVLCVGANIHAGEKGAPVVKADEAITWRERAVPGPAVTIRLKRTVGKSLIYEGSLHRTQQSASSYQEDDSFYLNMLCADQQEGRDLMAMWRTYLDRKRVEKYENGKTVDRALENSNDLINLGPNFNIVGTLRCYAYDAQNRIAYRTNQLLVLNDGKQVYGTLVSENEKQVVFLTDQEKLDLPREKVNSVTEVPAPHVCLNEAPHYFFPIFSERAVAPGETWRFRVPIIIPVEHGGGAKILPTQFTALMTGRLREVRESPEGKRAVVDYHVSGLFDSAQEEFNARLPAIFADNHLVHKIDGGGVAVVDLDKGRIVEKNESFAITLYASSFVIEPSKPFKEHENKPEPNKPPKLQESKAEINSLFDLKLLPPGTRLRSGAVVPPYE